MVALGRVVATPGALSALQEAGQTPEELLSRHVTGDWGDLCAEDIEANNRALEEGMRLLSSYTLRSDEKIWIITEADRSITTLLLPEEY